MVERLYDENLQINATVANAAVVTFYDHKFLILIK